MHNGLPDRLFGWIIGILSVFLVSLTLYTAYFGVFPDGLQRSGHLLLVIALVYVVAFRASMEREGPVGFSLTLQRLWILVVLAAGVIATGHHIVNFDAINDRWGEITDLEILFAVILMAVLFDACRRTVGWPIVILASIFLGYGLFGAFLPDGLAHRGYSLKRVTAQLYLGGGGIFGTPLGVSATFVTGVVVLGALLEKTGAGQVLMDFATGLTGRLRGGPAKAAVVGSSLMGMISGTAVANVLTTGPISIPLMRKSGYRKEAAGAIEAVASTGGQLMPPVMGAAAFIMAEFTATSYLTIAKAAFLPAVIFYAVLLAMVHFEAVKRNIPLLRDADSIVDWGSIAKRSYLLAPLPVFVGMLLNGYSIMLSSFWAVATSVIVSFFSRASAQTPRRMVETAIAAANAVIPVALACAAAGVIIGIITLTGIGLKFSTLVVLLSGGQLHVALVLTMLTCLILGMGLPTAAAYILVATLVAPALVDLGSRASGGASVCALFGDAVLDHTASCARGLRGGLDLARQPPEDRGLGLPVRHGRLRGSVLLCLRPSPSGDRRHLGKGRPVLRHRHRRRRRGQRGDDGLFCLPPECHRATRICAGSGALPKLGLAA